MPVLHLLGTGASLSTPDRTTTMLAVEGESTVVIDCGGDVVQRLLEAGVALDRLRVMILTHEHPDHVVGFPLFMQKLWLAGRTAPIAVCGPAAALQQARRLFDSFNTSGWSRLPPIDWREVELAENVTVWEDEEWKVTASPAKHSVPAIGVRIAGVQGNGAVTYSADTEPTGAIERLSRGADILVHEATGDYPGHTSAAAAARVAEEGGAGRLILVHIPANWDDEELRLARTIFPDTEAGRDGGRYDF